MWARGVVEGWGVGLTMAVSINSVQVLRPAQQVNELGRNAARFWLGKVADLRFGGLCSRWAAGVTLSDQYVTCR